ncbi:MAG: hypothetical protein G01um101424_362 [Parcubacteria group bacterium Gr01-1014_24]|nr:MAG: hypothetical protein G01um101424_362 [Parcubacteria group bacterium Gr01-1014_24]
MVSGAFVEDLPFIRVDIAWGQAVQAPFFILDTGFTGDLQVTPKIANELGLDVAGVTTARIANGQIVQVPTALALALMEGEVQSVQVLISESFPLAGISFLSKFGYKAIVDCKNKTVALEKAG